MTTKWSVSVALNTSGRYWLSASRWQYHKSIRTWQRSSAFRKRTGYRPIEATIARSEIRFVEGAKIPYGRLYPLSAAEEAYLEEYIQDNLRKGFICPSRSPASAPLFFIPKPDGSLRPCIE